jgi:hypothetical protein
MSLYDIKCVIVIADDLPLGLTANAAAVMGITLGREIPDILGAEGRDAAGERHRGLVKIPVPCLKAPRDRIKAIRDEATADPRLLVVDFSESALKAKTDKDYLENLATLAPTEIGYIALGLHGPKALVTRLTEKLSLLR